MATFYLDYAVGNDANAGSAFGAGTAWKTLTLGATAARIAPGDIIKIAKSPAPTSLGMTALWTNQSLSVVLGSALTAIIEDCEDAWVAAANVTATTSTTNKEGTNSCSLAVASGFTTGIVAYEALAGSTDFSGYQQVSFWIRSSAAIAAGVLTLDLCSDTVGATSVNSIAIPAIPAANRWQVVTVDTGGALGSAIQSISINAVSDPATPTILIDNIIACKASSSADSLTLSSLISKNSAEQGGTEAWYGIQSISGTTVKLDNDTNTEAGVGRGYCGTTETVTTYKRETIKTTAVSTASTAVQAVMDSGTSGNNISYQGGYDTATGNQTGETFFDGQNGMGYGIQIDSKSYVTLNRIGNYRYGTGFFFNGSPTQKNTIQNMSGCNCTADGFNFAYNSYDFGTIEISNANNNGGDGVDCPYPSNSILSVAQANNNLNNGVAIQTSCNHLTVETIGKANNNAQNGVRVSVFDVLIKEIVEANYNGLRGLSLVTTGCVVGSLSTVGNASASIEYYYGKNYIGTSSLSEATEISTPSSFSNAMVFINNYEGTGYCKIFTDGGNIVSEASTLTNGSGTQWKFTTATTTDRKSDYPLKLSIAKIAVTANNLVTVKAWFLKGHATNIGAKLVCRGDQIAGVAADVVATKANDTSEEELTITFTPTEAGVVEIEAWAYYVAGHSTVIVDALTITQA